MKTKLSAIIIVLVMLFPVSCIQQYWPDLGDKYDELLVVEGTITNKPGPYTVKLSRSTPLDLPNWLAYTGCDVAIICDDGTVENLLEQEAGIYLSSPNGMVGEIGKKYKINIHTPDNKIYESSFEKLQQAVEIASVYAEEEFRTVEGLSHQLEGYRFYVDTKPSEKSNNYLFWRLEATYQYNADFLAFFIYENDHLSVFPKADSLKSCWQTGNIPKLFTYQTTNLSDAVVKHFPLNFVSTEDRKLSVRYSLLVSQLTITEEAYHYWDAFRQQNENQGSLYTTQPYQIQGNLLNINNPDEPVLGYFLVAGISEKRIFVNRPNLHFYYSECHLSDPDYEAMRDVWISEENEWPIFITVDINWRKAYPVQSCIDCRLNGGTIETPDFWEY